MHVLKLVPVGEAVGLVLPREVLAKLRRVAGEMVFLTEVPEGLMLTAYDPAILDQLEAGHEFIDDFRVSLRILAE